MPQNEDNDFLHSIAAITTAQTIKNRKEEEQYLLKIRENVSESAAIKFSQWLGETNPEGLYNFDRNILKLIDLYLQLYSFNGMSVSVKFKDSYVEFRWTESENNLKSTTIVLEFFAHKIVVKLVDNDMSLLWNEEKYSSIKEYKVL